MCGTTSRLTRLFKIIAILPDEYFLIEKHVLKMKDNYILFVVSKDAAIIDGAFDEALK